MTKIYIKKTKYTESTREPSSNDDWDRGDTSSYWTFDGPFLNKPRLRSRDDYEVVTTDIDFKPGDLCYVVMAVWSSGDSFGWDDYYYADEFGAYRTAEEASAREEELRGKPKKGVYVPWGGYFDRFEYVEIVSGVLT